MDTSNSEEPNDFSGKWRSFVQSLRQVLSGAPVERWLDPYLPLRNATLEVCERADFVGSLQRSWTTFHSQTSPDTGHLLLLELAAFPAAVELADDKTEDVNKVDKSARKKRLLKAGKTTLDSVRDILDNLPPAAKGILKVLGEVIDLFRGD